MVLVTGEIALIVSEMGGNEPMFLGCFVLPLLRAQSSPVQSGYANTNSTNMLRVSKATHLLSHASAGKGFWGGSRRSQGVLGQGRGSAKQVEELRELLRRNQYKRWGNSARSAVRRNQSRPRWWSPTGTCCCRQTQPDLLL